MGQSVSRKDFIWIYTEQPHCSRRQQIVKAHPEIKSLFGVDESLKYVVASCVLFQTFLAYLMQDASWTLILLQCYFAGGVINHALTLAIHDIGHNTAFGNHQPLVNRLFGMFANLPLGVPMSISFKRYHVEHHRYLGEDGLDVDIPTPLEAKFFSTPFRKFIWLTLQPFFYAFRPLIIYKKVPTDLEVLNAVVQVTYDACIYYFFGWKALCYLLIGTYITMGVHPAAHYVFGKKDEEDKQETYSYYGPWNLVTYNVGYHMEHHDFPYIPGSRLPLVRKIAPEFYDNLKQHSSLTMVLWNFVFKADVGPYARLMRKQSVAQEMYGHNMLNAYIEAAMRYVGCGFVWEKLMNEFQSFSVDCCKEK
uniref:Sphingolipid 4-desaturase n=1 Tax=Rhabditophanes sp. KR3021 TaxID=114890 RepID=A0AC35UFV2_9BILA